METIVFADTFKKTFKNVLKPPKVVIDDPIFRMHYKFTGLSLLFASIMVSGYQFFGKPIMCIQRDDVPEQLLNTYCWIEGTFTLPKALSKKVGTEIVYAGVDKYVDGDEVVEHAFYQWVYFVLFLQALVFCLPHLLWRSLENGRMKNLVLKLRNPVLVKKEKDPCTSGLVYFFQGHRSEHKWYAFKYLSCEILNLIIVIAQIFVIDKFLGGEFQKYGVEVIKYSNEDQQNRVDPMVKVFPRVTKCTFHKYGSSGDVQRHDALCLLPLNIINEKVFIVMWFWFIVLAVLDALLIFYRLACMISSEFQFKLLQYASRFTKKDDFKPLGTLSYGDWFILYILADNISNLHFRDFIYELTGYQNNKPLEELPKPPTPPSSSGSRSLILDDVDGDTSLKLKPKDSDDEDRNESSV